MTALGNGLAANEQGREPSRMILRTRSNSVDEVSIVKAEKLGRGPGWKYLFFRKRA